MTGDLQDLCERGQAALMATDYLAAETALAEAERLAWEQRSFDTLSRLYMPLQETRRQIRQRCGEGVVCLNVIADGDYRLNPMQIVREHPHGQLLVAGWGTIEPALEVRRIARKEGLFVETFLAASYPTEEGRMVLIAGQEETPLPPAGKHKMAELARSGCLIIPERELPVGQRRGTYETYAEVMALWERLHAPYLAVADAEGDPLRRIELYRQTIDVDRACELAHQKLSSTAAQLLRRR